MEEFLYFLDGQMETPAIFGWFHLMFIGLVAISCVLIYIFRNRISKKAVWLTILITSIVQVVLEIYKQINFSFNYNGGGGNSYWDYQWYAFPFQFCSTPMYLMLVAGILRKGKVYDSILCYLSTFALFAGLAVTLYAGNVFVGTIGINIQTMVCHGSMFVIGFLLHATKSVKHDFSTIIKATIVFVAMLILALTMNIIWHYCGNDESFNMFYISPYLPCDALPILDMIYPLVPYPIFLLIYIFGFTLISCIMLYSALAFSKLDNFIHKNKSKDVTDKIIDIIKSDL